jgi:hypothetical protein
MPGNSKRRNEMRKSEKAKRKAAQRAKYQAYRDSGHNSKRAKISKAKKATIRKIRHRLTDCGNTGCQRCTPISFRPFIDKMDRAVGMPQWMYIQFEKIPVERRATL